MGMIRSFVYFDILTFRTLFKAIVRAHLEYTQSIWSPYKKKDIKAIENVQRRASKMLPYLQNLTYEERLRKLDLPTMVYRRLRGDMVEVYKILNQHYYPAVNINSQLRQGPTLGNSLKIFKPRCRTRLRQGVFHIRIVDAWNSLPNSVIEAKTTAEFEVKLDKYWERQEIEYDFEKTIITIAILGVKTMWYWWHIRRKLSDKKRNTTAKPPL